MSAQGLSHIILNASNTTDYENTLKFYHALGFEQVVDKSENTNQPESRAAWLKLSAGTDYASDATIKLVLNALAKSQPKPSKDLDWSAQENAIVLAVKDINVSVSKKKTD